MLVVGATGVLGMEVCRQLAAAGKKVKGLVRTSSQKGKVNGLHELGAETVTGDMKDPQSLYQAFQNVDAIISTATSTISHQEGDSIETVDLAGQLNVAEAASAAGVHRVVLISFPPYPPMTPEFPLQSAKRAVENRLKSKNFTYTILQPTYFMEIWLGPALGFDYVRAKAIIYGEGKNKISWIAIKDVARFAVASIENPSARNAVIQLGGPDDLSVLDAVGIFERESGQTFELQNIPDEALRAQMAAAPDSLGKTFSGLMIGLNEVGTIDMKETLRNFPIQLTSVREYARQMIAAEAKEAGVAAGLHSVSEGQHNFILGAGRVPEVDEQLSTWANIATAASDKMVLAVIAHLNEGNIEDAVALFADQFSFKDHGIRLEFNTKDRLAEFFWKARELYRDSLLQTERIFVSGSNALTEWTLQATLIEPAFGKSRWKVPILLHGAAVVCTENGMITSWSDYYDGLISRRTALASYFTEWVEY